jgi:hypothetical protein
MTNFSIAVRFQVLMAVSMKMIAFWDIAPCSLVEIYRCLRVAYWLHLRPDNGDGTHI